MCLTFFYINPTDNKDSPFKYIQAFNREEAYTRSSQPLDLWEEDPNIIGGRDNKEKGTWLGINTKTGNIAFLTNLPPRFMEAPPTSMESPSRGHLVSQFLQSNFFEKDHQDQEQEIMKGAIEIYLKGILAKIKDYKGFNLILGNLKIQEFWHLGNSKVETEACHLKEGVHMMTNLPFPQTIDLVKKPLDAFQEQISQKDLGSAEKNALMIEEIKKIMKSCNRSSVPVPTPVKDENGETKNITVMWGTKTSTLIVLDKENKLRVMETTFDEEQNMKSFIEKEIQL